MEKAKTNGKRGGQPGNRNAVKHMRFLADKMRSARSDAEFCRLARKMMRLIGYRSWFQKKQRVPMRGISNAVRQVR